MIVVCGEALIDLFMGPIKGQQAAATLVAGGSNFNVAIGLKRLGINSAFYGGLSTDPFGNFLASCLENDGVDLSLSPRVANSSPVMIVATDASGHPTYSFMGKDAAHTIALPVEMPAATKAIVFGSFSILSDPAGANFLALAQRETGRRVITVDPNIRSMVFIDMAQWKERLAKFFATANIIKASIEDLEQLYGKSVNAAEVAALWRSQGPSVVVITYGDRGATVFTGGEPLSIPGRAVKVVDTVGAGDTFHAAILAELDRRDLLTPAAVAGLDRAVLADVLGFATKAAAITCTRRGADLPTRAEVEAA